MALLRGYLIITLIFLITTTEVEKQEASVIFNKVTGKFSIVKEYNEESVAYGTYTPSYETVGWDFLTISSYIGESAKYNDIQKSYAMGYLEGYFTFKRILPFYKSLKAYHFKEFNGEMPEHTRKFFIDNFNFIVREGNRLKSIDPYWAHIISVYYQIKGLNEGYNAMVPEEDKISLVDFQVMNAFGDVTELLYTKKEARPNFKNMTKEEISTFIDLNTHCSALIKVAADLSDLWFGHNTWFSFNHMIRIFKEYRYHSLTSPEESQAVAFSSYPGNLASNDDFYITSNDLYVMETTNSVFNTDLYDLIVPESLLTWMRVIVCNRLAKTSKDWVEMFAKYNSGTYNNQYQVLDLKKVVVDDKIKKVEDEAFYIIEQIPEYVEIHDQTSVLKKGYWPSYNSPFSVTIQEKSGYFEYLEKYPELEVKYHYYKGARPSIFRRDQNKVNSIEDYKNLIRYNNYTLDSFTQGDPSLTIASRKDLAKENPLCAGNTDAKFASIKDVKGKKNKGIWIISGPTNQGVENFSWSKTQCNKDHKEFVHDGQVDEFNFSWMLYNTTLF